MWWPRPNNVSHLLGQLGYNGSLLHAPISSLNIVRVLHQLKKLCIISFTLSNSTSATCH